MLSIKQTVILNEMRPQDSITLKECVDLVGGDIYTNKNKHVGQILSRMVTKGIIERVKKGVFKIAENSCDNPNCFDITE